LDITGWKNRDKQGDLLKSIAKDVEISALEPLSLSPYWAPMFDTSMDITRRDKGALMMRHLDSTQTRSQTTFVKILHVSEGTAEYEEGLLRNEIASLPQPLVGVGISIGLDGASVNMGIHNGVAARLEVPATHCGGHKTNLACPHVESKVGRVTLLSDHLRGIATDLWASAKRNEKFRNLQLVIGEKAYEFLWAPRTRWMEIRKVCSRYISLYGSIDQFYEDLAVSEGEFAKGRLKNIRDVRFGCLFCHFLSDV
jgi:hypothetical protein